MADDSTTTTTASTTNASDDALARAKYEADSAKAANEKLKRQLEELKGQLLTDEQKQRYKELEEAAAKADEDNKKKAGQWDALKENLTKQHTREMEALRKQMADLEAERDAAKQAHDAETVGRMFAEASDWFGPNGKTVLIPEIAQTYFGKHVAVEVDDQGQRRVVVKDAMGQPILDPKTAKPAAFTEAMKQLIETHPSKDHLLRGSGKVGSNSAGGSHGTDSERDLGRLKAADFADPKVRDAVRKRQADAGGMQIGPAFDRVSR